MERLQVPQGEFELARHPVRPKEMLRAWDAADEYLLHHLADEHVDLDGTVLVVNDGSGALATALATHEPSLWSDSYVSHLAATANLERNGRRDAVEMLASVDPLPDEVDVALVKIPRSLALLEDQLHRLRGTLHPGSVVVGGAMAKHVHSSTIELFERLIGPTTTSLARKKARLLLATPDATRDPGPNPWPAHWTFDGTQVVNHAGVFSSGRLDIGTRFLLDHVGALDDAAHVVDLGCGNGVVGTVLATRHPSVTVTFIDESYMAVASAEATFRSNLGSERAARFVVGDTLGLLSEGDPIEPGTIDVIVNNPPFHIDQALGDATAWQMFVESRIALRPGGELWVVGNRHLAYHAKLKRLFGNCEVVASNAKFVLFRSVRT